jgi:hypothetical protein
MDRQGNIADKKAIRRPIAGQSHRSQRDKNACSLRWSILGVRLSYGAPLSLSVGCGVLHLLVIGYTVSWGKKKKKKKLQSRFDLLEQIQTM